ncbi:type II toxin-antitoxin system RelE/ParE family toxin [Microbacterium sp. TPD7012]|uniref:type II toxin-antitoxin system RelE/ParE family toxin n=1 Tax=Microbacterium sp. TPD7012 TaxID=2171975 RepID=UPI000D50B822|nr:type II toxin-antitoxin system RelE/ParE family toxin [Microbacterium sp. TPD7012]PVE94974.1 hypothetical protein DC434_13695 [Microbacterium sp. TPD7012]
MSAWNVQQQDAFERAFDKLPQYEQAVMVAAIEKVLGVLGHEVCATEWGKNLGEGLYEFRVRKSLRAIHDEFKENGVDLPALPPGSDRGVLLRAFFTVHGDRIVLLLHIYDKKRDPSEKRQQREIKRARKLLKAWLEEEKRKAALERKGRA